MFDTAAARVRGDCGQGRGPGNRLRCRRRGEMLYVQVAYLLATEEMVECEFGVYDLIWDNYPKYVVTMDELDVSRNGIKHRNIRDFLTAEELN